ncbi:hypothetical protein FISHEDRAFT_58142 [Fistulina hepatica ATCC 64428]|nr:hypothetical protein FISHEDRAFT_58142 [Fistulina hepatica ATCC 64428]
MFVVVQRARQDADVDWDKSILVHVRFQCTGVDIVIWYPGTLMPKTATICKSIFPWSWPYTRKKCGKILAVVCLSDHQVQSQFARSMMCTEPDEHVPDTRADRDLERNESRQGLSERAWWQVYRYDHTSCQAIGMWCREETTYAVEVSSPSAGRWSPGWIQNMLSVKCTELRAERVRVDEIGHILSGKMEQI